MAMLNITGNIDSLSQVVKILIDSKRFHPAGADKTVHNKGEQLREQNPYTPMISKLKHIAEMLSVKLTYSPIEKKFSVDEIDGFLFSAAERGGELVSRKTAAAEKLASYRSSAEWIAHLSKMSVNFEDLFNCHHISIRFGRLPKDAQVKLAFYQDEEFVFVPLDVSETFIWGVYFCPLETSEDIDEIFNSLFFERTWIPTFVHGKGDIARRDIQVYIDAAEERITEIEGQLSALKSEVLDSLEQMYCWLYYQSEIFAGRSFATVKNETFYLSGYTLLAGADELYESLEQIGSVLCECSAAKQAADVPVRIKNGRFSKPFEVWLAMYGLPAYGEFDPTALMAVSYTILFGVMFGDVGQGFIVFAAGLLLTLWKKANFGKIAMRLGVSSMIMGFVYGSVFGLEHVLDPLYRAVGFAHKPVEVFKGGTTTTILLLSVGMGGIMIMLSICINIWIGLKKKDYARAVFGENGIAGLVFYLSVMAGVVLLLIFNINVLTVFYWIFAVGLPLLVMFFRQPLARLVRTRKMKLGDSVPSFISQNFFECFEFLLSYVSNTMSFVRIGGFIMSHAGMMLVVMTIAKMFGPVGNTIVMIVGNLFVIGMEGFMIGIQVLRLQFYEMFSRYYDGAGKSFRPSGKLTD
jgi:Archaeal/vacuolar-type H+-ATPase subunit I